MRERSPQLILMALRRFLFSARRTALRQLLEETINAAWDEGYHFSDVLTVLSQFVRENNIFIGDNEETRTTVAALLEEAATEAEAPGRQLP